TIAVLLSMTGYGEARLQDERWSVAVEVRTVNNRHLKLTTKISEPYGALEPEIERLGRDRIRRGAGQLPRRIQRTHRGEDYRLNLVALESYRDQLVRLLNGGGGGGAKSVDFSTLLALPGVVDEARPGPMDPQDDWPALAGVVAEALKRLEGVRRQEGS